MILGLCSYLQRGGGGVGTRKCSIKQVYKGNITLVRRLCSSGFERYSLLKSSIYFGSTCSDERLTLEKLSFYSGNLNLPKAFLHREGGGKRTWFSKTQKRWVYQSSILLGLKNLKENSKTCQHSWHFFPEIPVTALTATLTAPPHLLKRLKEIYYSQLLWVFKNPAISRFQSLFPSVFSSEKKSSGNEVYQWLLLYLSAVSAHKRG